MLEQFSVTNYLSFKEKATITMVPESISEIPGNLYSIADYKVKLMKGLGFFGMNSAGKSNLIKAFQLSQSFILGRLGGMASDKIEGLTPFMLDEEFQKKPSEFEFIFWLGYKRYRYGFITTKDIVKEEWLLVVENKKEKVIFQRNTTIYYFGREYKKEVEIFSGKIGPKELFITFCARLNVEFAVDVISWFKKITILFEYDINKLAEQTMKLIETEAVYRTKLENIIRDSEFGIESLKLSNRGGATIVETGHKYKGKDEDIYWFDLVKNESLGTIKFFGILGPIIKTLNTGGLLLIDEIDSGFHAELGIHLLNLFFKTKNERDFPQLIFTSHNHEIWDKKVLRRDQQYHVIKSDYGESTLTRTYDAKIRKVKSV
ncbi:MAG: hypothetical protein RLZZ546_1197, partial [Bacteroidota bacterium]